MRALAIFAGAVALALVLGSSHLLDAPSDADAEAASAASLRDALATAQAQRPELWTPERKARADKAAGLVARGVQP